MEADRRGQSMGGGDLVEERIGEENWPAPCSPSTGD